MPSINELMDYALPVIREEVAQAVLSEREYTLQELGKFLDRDPSIEDVRQWYEANLALIEYVRDGDRP